MIRLLQQPPPEIGRPLENVLRQAVEAGAPVPAWVAVEDDSGSWIQAVAACPAVERARGVVVLGSDQAISDAIRLGVGGALRLPPSTVRTIAALQAAAQATPGPDADFGLIDLAFAVEGDGLVVSWANRPFWRCQLGEPEMSSLMRALADELQLIPALAPGPALVVSGRSRNEIQSAWAQVTDRRGIPTQGVHLRQCRFPAGHCGALDAVLRALTEPPDGADDQPPASPPTQPVFELPSGRRVGCWSPVEGEQAPPRGWRAWPVSETSLGYQWRLRHADGGEDSVEDVLSADRVAVPALRIPGWVAAGIAEGRPAALMVERLAAAAARAGLPLWVPNVDRPALDLLLRLPGSFWVDGPAAPREEGTEP
jgi:hypothetical protein